MKILTTGAGGFAGWARVKRLAVITTVTTAVGLATKFGWRMGAHSDWRSSGANVKLTEQLKEHVKRLSGDIGDRSVFRYPGLQAARDYIISEFRACGYEPELQTHMAAGKMASNIIAVKRGVSRPGEVIVLGAHYDTCDNPGADDNASGVAGVLAAAKALVEAGTARTVKFIAFVNEEPPYFYTEEMGSRLYARKARESGEDIKGALILEMIGYYSDRPFSQKYPPLIGPFFPNKGNYIALVADLRSRGLAGNVEKSFRARTDFPLEKAILPSFVPGVTFSDHSSFWKYGYPAVMFTDTAFYRNSNYHKHTDTWGTLDYVRMADFTDGVIAAVSALAER